MSDLNLLYTELETDLRSSLRQMLNDRCTPAAVTRTYEGDRSLSATLWKSLAQEIGVTGLLIPEDRGGVGATTREAAVVLEELGRAVAPVPFLTSSVIATTALLSTEATNDVNTLLESLGSGDSVIALATSLSTFSSTGIGSEVTVDPNGHLTGRITSVAGALDSDQLLIPVRTSQGLSIHLVQTSNVELVPITSLDMTRPLADVVLSNTASSLVVPEHLGEAVIDRALTAGAALLASEQLGVAQWCLETTVAYTKERQQFGRLIGSFQALKHRLADVFVAVETSVGAARYAAATLAADDPDLPVATSVAKAFCGDAAVRAAEEAVQLHGGMGMTWEHPAHLYLKRAKADQLALGGSGYHRILLSTLVDLPL